MNPRTKNDSIYQEVHVPGNPWVARCISTGTRRVMTRTRSKSRSRVTSLTLGPFSLHLTASVVVAPLRIFPGRFRTHTTFKRSESCAWKKKTVPSLFDLLITLTSFHIFRTILFIISFIYSNTCWLKNYYEIIARVIGKYYRKNHWLVCNFGV